MSEPRIPAAPGLADRIRAIVPVPSVLVGIAALSLWIAREEKPPAPAAPRPAAPAQVEPREDESEPEDAEPEPQAFVPPPAPPKVDAAVMAKAEASLDQASRDRARAEARLAEVERETSRTANQAALDAVRARKMAFRVRDPSAQIARASARGGVLKTERDKLAAEVASLRSLPLPKATSILTKNPVARPAGGDEFHFELRRDRVGYINLERLLDLAKSDAQVRIRMVDRMGMLSSQVGPVDSYSLSYVLGRAQVGIDELMERTSVRFDLKGWEVVPTSERRGEAYEATRNPISQYARVLNRLTPGRSIITMWVYPDSFNLYRKLRDELTGMGFSVAARPLPEGMSIRGSPMGSVSAAQ